MDKKGIDSLFVSALYYSINKAIYEVMGNGGKVLGRRASYEMIRFFRDLGYIKENMSNDEIKDVFVDKFGLAGDLNIIEENDKVIFEIIKPTLILFLRKLMEENLKPYICPFIHLLSELYSETKDCRLMLLDVIPESPEKVKLIFKKV